MREDIRQNPKIIVMRMKNEGRVLHQTLNKAIFHKAGSKGFVSKSHQFCLCHFLIEAKINVPNILFNAFKSYVVNWENSNAIPFGVILSKVFVSQHIYNMLELGNLKD